MPPTPSGDALQDSTSLALRNLLQTHVVHFPVDASDLLRLLIAHTPSVTELQEANHLETDAKPWAPRLKLQDLSVFEGMLERWAEKWEYGMIAVVKTGQDGSISVVGAQVTDPGGSRKRKRGEGDVKHGAFWCFGHIYSDWELNVFTRCCYE